jgi:hypothetical protein
LSKVSVQLPTIAGCGKSPSRCSQWDAEGQSASSSSRDEQARDYQPKLAFGIVLAASFATGHQFVFATADDQYGGGLRCRCIFAASIHHARSSAKRGNTRFESVVALARGRSISVKGARSDQRRSRLKSPPTHLGEGAVRLIEFAQPVRRHSANDTLSESCSLALRAASGAISSQTTPSRR